MVLIYDEMSREVEGIVAVARTADVVFGEYLNYFIDIHLDRNK